MQSKCRTGADTKWVSRGQNWSRIILSMTSHYCSCEKYPELCQGFTKVIEKRRNRFLIESKHWGVPRFTKIQDCFLQTTFPSHLGWDGNFVKNPLHCVHENKNNEQKESCWKRWWQQKYLWEEDRSTLLTCNPTCTPYSHQRFIQINWSSLFAVWNCGLKSLKNKWIA